jgi:hypothetical protein
MEKRFYKKLTFAKKKNVAKWPLSPMSNNTTLKGNKMKK